MMNNKLETTFFLATLATFAYFVRWCIREMRQAPVHREFTQEELQAIWEQQQQEKYEKELEWEAEND